MTTLFARASSFLNRSMPKANGGEILYQRGERSCWLTATFGTTEFQTETAGSVSIDHSDRDFIVEAEALILDGELTTPARGDRITVVNDAGLDEQVFEVLAPAGAQVFNLCDSLGKRMRIHTMRRTA